MPPRVFYLLRIEDETGTSGTGVVAEGIQWSGGGASVHWLGATPCVHFWPGGVEHVRRVHGHSGKTRVVWADEEDILLLYPINTYKDTRAPAERTGEEPADRLREPSPDAAGASQAGPGTSGGPPGLGKSNGAGEGA
jgi:hypothetical protein